MSRNLLVTCLALTVGLGLMASQVASQTPTATTPQPDEAHSPPPAPAGSDAAAAPEEDPQTQAVIAAVGRFAQAYTSGDTQTLEDCFLDDATVVDSEGNDTRGKEAVVGMYVSALEQTPGLKLESQVNEVRFITPEVARVEGRSRLSVVDGEASEFTRFSALLVHRDGKWQAAEIREYPLPVEEITPYERLQELEWMVGDWVDEGEANRVTASIRWAENQSYLIRTYAVEIEGEKASSGTMFIGWDPQSGQIKSWLFDSQGGHGEGLWTRTSQNQWVVKAQGVLRDGRPTSATQIHTILNKDTVKTDSIDRIIGGQIAPDIVDIVMVRKPPQPNSTQPAAETSR
jgi:uncharacterized protein (TIGR02246 family)